MTFAVNRPARGSDQAKTWTPIPGASTKRSGFFQFNDTVYELDLLRRFDAQTTFSHTAAMTFQTEYAALHGRNGCFGMMAFSRTWLVYSLLQFLEEMGEIKSGPQSGTEALKLRLGVVRRSGDIKSDLDVTLEAWTPRLGF